MNAINPLVSVVVIVYNQAETIIQTLESILNQKCNFPVELIVSNDCSSDNTDSVISEFLSKKVINPLFVVNYTSQANNKGVINNFVWSIKECKGEFISFCEGDDYWIDDKKIQKQVDFLNKHEECGLVHTNYQILDLNTNKFTTNKFLKTKEPYTDFSEYLFNGEIRTLTVMWRSSCKDATLELFSADFMHTAPFGDRPLFLLIGSQSKIGFINDFTGVYRITDSESASHSQDPVKLYQFLDRVNKANLNLYDYLELENPMYLRQLHRNLATFELLLSRFVSFKAFVNKFFKKTMTDFWTLNEFKQVIAVMRCKNGI